MKIKFFLISLLFCCFGVAQITAQPEPSVLFPEGEKIEWTSYFKGRIDDLNDIAIGLASNGQEVRGWLIYLRSKFQLKLEGTYKRGHLTLKEIDEDDQVSGFLIGKIEQGQLHAEWLNYDKSISADLRLSKVNEWPDFPTHCGDNKWIRVYRGNIGEETAECILQRYSYNKLKGIVYLGSRNQSFHASGKLNGKRMTLSLKNDFGEEAGLINGIFIKENRLELDYLSEDGIEAAGEVKQQENVAFGCIEYADYLSSYDFTYPKFKSQTLNIWINTIVDQWLEKTHEQTKALKVDLKNALPSQRANYRSYGWTDIVCYSENIISGHIYYSDNWNKTEEEIAFNFDEATNSFLYYDNVFKPHEEIRESIDEYIKLAFRKHPMYEQTAFREWINSISFQEFTFRRDGIQFSTPFSPIFGKHQIAVSYDKLKGFFKPDSPGFRFLKN